MWGEREGIKILQFKLRLSPSKLHVVKQRASRNFIEGEVGAEIEGSYRSDPTLLSCTIHFLLSELRHLGKHAEATVETLACLVDPIVLNGGFSLKHVSVVFAFIKDAVVQAGNSFSFQFARVALFAMAPKLNDYPQYVFELLRDNHFVLYERLQMVDHFHKTPLSDHPPALFGLQWTPADSNRLFSGSMWFCFRERRTRRRPATPQRISCAFSSSRRTQPSTRNVASHTTVPRPLSLVPARITWPQGIGRLHVTPRR
jgi:hypothetical protein